MAKIQAENVTIDSANDNVLEIITNLSRDIGAVDDRLTRLEEEGITLSLKVEKGEIVATLK